MFSCLDDPMWTNQAGPPLPLLSPVMASTPRRTTHASVFCAWAPVHPEPIPRSVGCRPRTLFLDDDEVVPVSPSSSFSVPETPLEDPVAELSPSLRDVDSAMPIPILHSNNHETTIRDLLAAADQSLFKRVLTDEIHVLQPLLPGKTNFSYNLRSRRHNRINKENCTCY